jgi:hypothetical protein
MSTFIFDFMRAHHQGQVVVRQEVRRDVRAERETDTAARGAAARTRLGVYSHTVRSHSHTVTPTIITKCYSNDDNYNVCKEKKERKDSFSRTGQDMTVSHRSRAGRT